jgi:HNH endonuclease
MSRNIPYVLRQQVAERAGFCCEYCKIPEAILASVFHIDHIRSLKHGGRTILSNLAYACPHCNQNKGADIATFLDEESEEIVRLFNPRKDMWDDHFIAVAGEILAKTAIGDATNRLLELNQPERLILRRELAEAGLYP